MCICHNYVRIEDVDQSFCGECFVTLRQVPDHLKEKYPKGYCPHGFKVCPRCGKSVGYGSHGRLTVVPDSCKKQVASMGGK